MSTGLLMEIRFQGNIWIESYSKSGHVLDIWLYQTTHSIGHKNHFVINLDESHFARFLDKAQWLYSTVFCCVKNKLSVGDTKCLVYKVFKVCWHHFCPSNPMKRTGSFDTPSFSLVVISTPGRGSSCWVILLFTTAGEEGGGAADEEVNER